MLVDRERPHPVPSSCVNAKDLAAHAGVSVVAMETAELNIPSSRFVSALERVLLRYGYRAMRSFDLHLEKDEATYPPLAEQQCQCGCGYTVLLVFANASQAGLEGTISVRGIDERSIVSLAVPEGEGELEAQFPTILVETVQMKNSEEGEPCRCAQA
jgi:hypothetical protein